MRLSLKCYQLQWTRSPHSNYKMAGFKHPDYKMAGLDMNATPLASGQFLSPQNGSHKNGKNLNPETSAENRFLYKANCSVVSCKGHMSSHSGRETPAGVSPLLQRIQTGNSWSTIVSQMVAKHKHT